MASREVEHRIRIRGRTYRRLKRMAWILEVRPSQLMEFLVEEALKNEEGLKRRFREVKGIAAGQD